MRILFPFLGDTVGGSHISDLEIIKALDLDQAYQPCVLLHENGPLADYLSARDVSHVMQSDVFVPKSLKSLLLKLPKFIASVITAKKYLKTHQIDVVYCSDGPLIYIWFFAAKLANKKIVLTQHGRIKNNAFKSYIYQHLSALICNSHHSLSLLPSLPKNNLYQISFPCINANNVKNNLIKNNNLNDMLHVGYIANMRDWKRPLLFIEIASILLQYNIKCHFYMIGRAYGDYSQKMQQAISDLGIDDHISIVGFIDDKSEYMQKFDIVVCTAVNEPFGLVPVESGFYYLPVVASNSGGHIETIIDGKTGYLAEPDNAQDFADKLLDLYNNPEKRQSMGRAAHAFVCDQFAPNKQIEKITTLLDVVMR